MQLQQRKGGVGGGVLPVGEKKSELFSRSLEGITLLSYQEALSKAAPAPAALRFESRVLIELFPSDSRWMRKVVCFLGNVLSQLSAVVTRCLLCQVDIRMDRQPLIRSVVAVYSAQIRIISHQD